MTEVEKALKEVTLERNSLHQKLEDLSKEFTALKVNQEPKVTVLSRDRKLRKFGGKEEDYRSWELDARAAIEGLDNGAEFLYRRLEGVAKTEIDCRGVARDCELILQAL